MNALKFRPFAEKVGAAFAANPKGRIAINIHKNAQIKKFEIVGSSNVMNFLDKPGRQWVLLKLRDFKEIEKSSFKDVKFILVGTVSGDRWFLLSSCREGCDDQSIATKSINQPSAASPDAVSVNPATKTFVSGR